jgi:hypothetical protein
LARADEVAVNVGFETAGSGGAADSANWNEPFGGATGTLSMRDSTSPRTGAFAQHLVAVGSAAMGADAFVTQNSIADGGRPSLQENTPLSASFHAKLNLGPGGVVFYQLKILNGVGGVVAQTGLGVITSGTGGAYQAYSMGPINVPAFGAAPNDVYAAYLEIKAAAGAFAGSTAEAFVDDVSITGSLLGGAQTGACCAAGNVCSVATQAACSGAYQGDGTTCTPNPCVPLVTGACCATSGVCTVGTQAACSGAYQGNDTTCTPNPCPIPDQIVFNGGFETAGFGGPTDSFGWNQGASGAPGSLSMRDGTSPHTGGFAQHLVALGGDGMGANAVITQNSLTDGGMPSLQQNTTLSATFSAKLALGPGGVGFYTLRILDGGGTIVASTGLGVITGGTAGAYQTFSMGPITVPAFGAPPTDVYAALIEINVAAGAFVGSTAEAYIDDVNIIGTLVGAMPQTGACCAGTTCSVQSSTACSGVNTSYKGDGTTCNAAGNTTTPCCQADYNQSGAVTVQDIFDFLAGYFTSAPEADINGVGGVTVQDIFDYLAAYFSGCA